MGVKKRRVLVLLALALGLALLPSPVAASGSVTTVATGLDSPRGIAFYHGKMLVAEAGHGGSDCFTPPGNPFPICIGNTSRISWVNPATHGHIPFVTGLFSVSLGPEGVLGVSGLSVSDGRILAQISSTPQETPPSSAIGQQQAGRLISVQTDGHWSSVAPVGATDFTYTLGFTQPTQGVYSPGTQEHDSNPTGVLATQEGAFVADSGSNTLDYINGDGKIKIRLHDEWRDPNPNNFPSDSVPTCVARGEDSLFVGELSGRLLKVNGSSFTPVTVRDSAGSSLLTHVTGCTSDGKGNIYFVNMFGAGAPFTRPPTSSFFIGNVVKYNSETGRASVLASGLQFPNMDAIGPDGNLYVTAGSICPTLGVAAQPCFGGTGTILKIILPHED